MPVQIAKREWGCAIKSWSPEKAWGRVSKRHWSSQFNRSFPGLRWA